MCMKRASVSRPGYVMGMTRPSWLRNRDYSPILVTSLGLLMRSLMGQELLQMTGQSYQTQRHMCLLYHLSCIPPGAPRPPFSLIRPHPVDMTAWL